MGETVKGTVKWFNESKGYGFLSQPEGEDIFVHYTAIQANGFRTLKEGQEVRVKVLETDERGRIKLSMKAVQAEESANADAPAEKKAEA